MEFHCWSEAECRQRMCMQSGDGVCLQALWGSSSPSAAEICEMLDDICIKQLCGLIQLARRWQVQCAGSMQCLIHFPIA